jgi:hypothetical protein
LKKKSNRVKQIVESVKKASFIETEEETKSDVKESSDGFQPELEQLTLSDVDVSKGELDDLSEIE